VLTLLFYSLRALRRSRSDLLRENVALGQQINTLIQTKPLPRVPPEERILWVALRRTWSRCVKTARTRVLWIRPRPCGTSLSRGRAPASVSPLMAAFLEPDLKRDGVHAGRTRNPSRFDASAPGPIDSGETKANALAYRAVEQRSRRRGAMSKSLERWMWLAESSLLAAILGASALTLLALRALWGDVDRVATRATGIELPWAALVLVAATVLGVHYVARSVSLARRRSLRSLNLPGRGAALLDLPVIALFDTMTFVLFTQASDAVLVSEISYGWERVAGPAFVEPEAEAAVDLLPDQRFDERSLFDGDADPEYVTFRIPSLVVTRNGTVLAYCEARGGYSD